MTAKWGSKVKMFFETLSTPQSREYRSSPSSSTDSTSSSPSSPSEMTPEGSPKLTTRQTYNSPNLLPFSLNSSLPNAVPPTSGSSKPESSSYMSDSSFSSTWKRGEIRKKGISRHQSTLSIMKMKKDELEGGRSPKQRRRSKTGGEALNKESERLRQKGFQQISEQSNSHQFDYDFKEKRMMQNHEQFERKKEKALQYERTPPYLDFLPKPSAEPTPTKDKSTGKDNALTPVPSSASHALIRSMSSSTISMNSYIHLGEGNESEDEDDDEVDDGQELLIEVDDFSAIETRSSRSVSTTSSVRWSSGSFVDILGSYSSANTEDVIPSTPQYEIDESSIDWDSAFLSLEILFEKRSSHYELESRNILKASIFLSACIHATQQRLKFKQTADRIEARLLTRPTRRVLVERNIIKEGHRLPANKRHTTSFEETADTIRSKLMNRPDRRSLIIHNVIKGDMNGFVSSHVQGVQQAIKFQPIISLLNPKLEHRPPIDYLIDNNILKERDANSNNNNNGKSRSRSPDQIGFQQRRNRLSTKLENRPASARVAQDRHSITMKEYYLDDNEEGSSYLDTLLGFTASDEPQEESDSKEEEL